MEDLKRFGISRVPAVVVGDRAVHGWNPKGVAELVGVAYTEARRLSTDELAKRLDTILVAAQRALRQVPADRLDTKTPGRDRTLRQLGYHIFRVAASYKDAMESGFLPEAWFGEQAPAGQDDVTGLVRYGESVRRRLEDWLQQPAAHAGDVQTYYGSHTAYDFFERTVWHTAQHLRQIYVLLETIGITPEAPLTEVDFQGLPLPENIW